MNLTLRVLVVLNLIFIAGGCGMKNINYEKTMDEIFKSYNGKSYPGASVMLIKDGKVIFEKGYGTADFKRMRGVTPETNFRLASVTKQFTAASILLLIARGDLSFDDSLRDIFSDFPGYGKSITVEHLLQHTSGLIDYESLIPDSATVQVKDKDVFEMMMGVDSTYFEPGSKHQYSNTGYALLAMIVEKISGGRFADFLRHNIFGPLNMENTVAFENGISEVTNRAFGYTIKNDSIMFTDQSITSAVLGDGGIYSSTRDLYKWDQALYTDTIISQNYLQKSFSRGKTTDGSSFDYGYGWRLEEYQGHEVVFHTGSSRGFRNIFYRIPSENFSLIILTNRDEGGEMSTLDLAHKIVDLILVN